MESVGGTYDCATLLPSLRERLSISKLRMAVLKSSINRSQQYRSTTDDERRMYESLEEIHLHSSSPRNIRR